MWAMHTQSQSVRIVIALTFSGLAIALLGCPKTKAIQEEPTPAEPVKEEPATRSAPSDLKAESHMGSWSSAGCGERSYVRELTLAVDGTFVGRELVSPCPPGAHCIWSGIVDTSGTWSRQGEVVSLAFKGVEDSPGPTLAFPEQLTYTDGHLVEAGEGEGCTYQRGISSSSNTFFK